MVPICQKTNYRLKKSNIVLPVYIPQFMRHCNSQIWEHDYAPIQKITHHLDGGKTAENCCRAEQSMVCYELCDVF